MFCPLLKALVFFFHLIKEETFHFQEDGVDVLFPIPPAKYNRLSWNITYKTNVRRLWKVERRRTGPEPQDIGPTQKCVPWVFFPAHVF